MELFADKSVAKLAQKHLQMLGAGSVISTIDEHLCITSDLVKSLQIFVVQIEILGHVNETVFQSLAVTFKAFCLNNRSKGHVF